MTNFPRVRRLLLCACSAVAAALPVLTPARPAAASLPPSLTIVGHGWGHGRGMGQYGAYGYALAGQSYQWILGHYYGGTTMGAVAPGATITVRLVELDGDTSVTVKDSTGTVRTLSAGSPAYTPTGGVAWVSWPGGTWRPFEGQIQVLAGGETLNVVALEDYVRAVVPAESPASWGAYGGEAALEAQAVAARSYAWAYTAGGANPICDTTACQVYQGDPDVSGDPGYSTYTTYSDQAATSTAGQIRVWSSGAPALTEFSSSTGGYTAGGAFPAVVDAGDATPSNPNHDWTVTIPTSTVQAAFPQVGTLESITVTARNGLGDLGGRVLQVVVSGATGSLAVTGSQFAADVGLRSDWFAIDSTAVSAQGNGDDGYWVVASGGQVDAFGAAPYLGSMAGTGYGPSVVGLAPTVDAAGYWEVTSGGAVFIFGDAQFYGSASKLHLNQPMLGMAPTDDGAGYWLYAADGGIFSFGDAHFYGSTGSLRLNEPIVGMASTSDGKGYWLVAADGGIFSFGDAHFYGSTGSLRLNKPIVGMVPTASGHGYWLIGQDGGIFSFGDAGFVGSLPGIGVRDTVTGVAPTADGHGYWMIGAGGTVYPFGSATFFGDPAKDVPGWSGTALGIFAHKA